MSESKFTPGPWAAHRSTRDDGSWLMAIDMPNGYKEDYAWISNDREPGSEWANAHLIAAAPEMYEALNLLLNDNCLMNAISREQAMAIFGSIRKAEGK